MFLLDWNMEPGLIEKESIVCFLLFFPFQELFQIFFFLNPFPWQFE